MEGNSLHPAQAVGAMTDFAPGRNKAMGGTGGAVGVGKAGIPFNISGNSGA